MAKGRESLRHSSEEKACSLKGLVLLTLLKLRRYKYHLFIRELRTNRTIDPETRKLIKLVFLKSRVRNRSSFQEHR